MKGEVIMSQRILSQARHFLSSLIVTDDYGQWGFTDRGAYLALSACAALLLLAGHLSYVWGC